MSKRHKIRSEYYKEHGNYKTYEKPSYSEHYVKWLEDKLIDKTTEDVLPEVNISQLQEAKEGWPKDGYRFKIGFFKKGV